MKGRLKRTALAENDLLEIWSYIAKDNVAAADRVLDRLDDRSRLLADSPGLGVRRDDLEPGVRSFRVGSYLVLYRETENGIEVVRYLHGRRDIRRVLQR